MTEIGHVVSKTVQENWKFAINTFNYSQISLSYFRRNSRDVWWTAVYMNANITGDKGR